MVTVLQWYGVARDVPFCRGMAMKREEKDSKVGRGFGKVMKCAAEVSQGRTMQSKGNEWFGRVEEKRGYAMKSPA